MSNSLSEWIDISVPLKTGMVHWPGDPAAKITLAKSMAGGDAANVSHLDMGAHTGTHMDAPLHFVADGAGMETMPLEATIGPARVIEIRDPESIKAAELERHELRRGERVLFKTSNSERCWRTDDFVEDFVHIAEDGAKHLAERGVMTVGIDYLSVGGYEKDAVETHVALLEAGIWVIEGLDLSEIAPGLYDLVALPLKILGGDGAPARAALRARTI